MTEQDHYTFTCGGREMGGEADPPTLQWGDAWRGNWRDRKSMSVVRSCQEMARD